MTARLVVLTDFYYPATAAGGPPKGIRAAVMDQPDLDVHVFCRDRDHLALSSFAAPFQGTVTVDDVMVSYLPVRLCREAVRGFALLLTSLRRADAVWLNSLHSRLFVLPWLLLLVLMRASVLLSPRGEMAASAILSSRPKLKRTWHAVLRRTGVDRRVLWIASSEHESADISATFPRARVFLMPERTLLTAQQLEHKARTGPLQLLCLGRICPIKGLDLGLQVLAHVRTPMRLDVVGPVEDPHHLAALKRAVAGLSSPVEVCWHAPVGSDEVAALIRRSDALFNPTRGENFGHAIAESLALGRPAIVGPGTPWSFAESTGAVVVLDFGRPVESATRLDDLATQTPEEVMAVQRAARRVGLSGLPGEGDLAHAVRQAHRRRTRDDG